jgi:hypothetical protein
MWRAMKATKTNRPLSKEDIGLLKETLIKLLRNRKSYSAIGINISRNISVCKDAIQSETASQADWRILMRYYAFLE